MFDDLMDRRGPFYVLVLAGLVVLGLVGFGVFRVATGVIGSVVGDDGGSVATPSIDFASAAADGGFESSLTYADNLNMLRSASVRNTNHDNSPYRNVPSAELRLEDHYGPRSEYLSEVSGNPEPSFPIAAGGQFRASCEFSHFGYDDPLVFPGRPGASHLHMFFGNTDVNAFSTYDSLLNSGSSTCNGQELNRTGYWVPALFDAQGAVRIPERVVVYYKGEGRARGEAQTFPEEAALIATSNINTLSLDEGGAGGKLGFVCTNNFSAPSDDGAQTLPVCDGSLYADQGLGDSTRVVLEMNVKFPQCWNGEDPADWNNYIPAAGGWYASNCTGEHDQILPNLEYFVNYVVEPGETTEGWYLSSDVDPTAFGTARATGGSSTHGDWWGAWNAEVADLWIDNCVNFIADVPSGCGFGYLTDGGPDNQNPAEGPALRFRPQYDGPQRVSAEQLYQELCPASADRPYQRPEDAAYCVPGIGL